MTQGEPQSSPAGLGVTLAGMRLRTPLVVASGVWGYGEEHARSPQMRHLGAFVLKTTTLRPRAGNPPGSRTVETPAGLVNSIGLENPGIEVFLSDKLPRARELGLPLIASIAGETTDEFAELAARLGEAEGIAALELNISCPNVERHGMAFGADAQTAAAVVAACRARWQRPLIAKLTPNVTDIAEVARACEAAGADIIALVNTFTAMCIDIRTRRPRLGANFGGLSGPAIRPAAVLRVYRVAQAVRAPIIGMGGVWDAEDALEFIIAGATAVGLGTCLLADPEKPQEIAQGMRNFLRGENGASIRGLVGLVRLNP
ncbi:MAG TPA: dihydroorotate dehydrogenase [Armatimonadota bacterium]|nr:dihydroorotate dehydrogenase [Armatimonadota bacterium]